MCRRRLCRQSKSGRAMRLAFFIMRSTILPSMRLHESCGCVQPKALFYGINYISMRSVAMLPQKVCGLPGFAGIDFL